MLVRPAAYRGRAALNGVWQPYLKVMFWVVVEGLPPHLTSRE